jgi:hypothetical protein
VKPYDEDEEKDDQFLFSFFPVIKHRWNEIDRVKPKYSGKNLSQCHSPQIPHGLTRDRTWAYAVGVWRLTAEPWHGLFPDLNLTSKLGSHVS